MAASEKASQLCELLECSICLDRFKNPRMLPCQHSYCETCLGKHLEETKNESLFFCPLCKAEFNVPQEGALGFQPNTSLIEIDALLSDGDNAKCSICKRRECDANATSVCVSCRDNLCRDCALSHRNTKPNFDHKVVKLDEIDTKDFSEEICRSAKTFCPIHDEEVLRKHCLDCATSLCNLCNAVHPTNHRMKSIEEAAYEAHEEMRKLHKELVIRERHFQMVFEKEKGFFNGIEGKRTGGLSALKRKYEDFRQDILHRIDAEEKLVLENFEKQVAAEKEQARKELSQSEAEWSTFSGAAKCAGKVLKTVRHAETIEQCRGLKARLKTGTYRTVHHVIEPYFTMSLENTTVPVLEITVNKKSKYHDIPSNIAGSSIYDTPILRSLH